MPDESAPAPVVLRSVLDWKRRKGTDRIVFASTCIRVGWVTDPQVQPSECDESTYDDAVHTTAHARL